MDIPTIRRIAYGFVVTVIIACCVVVAASEHFRADRATQRAERAEEHLSTTQGELMRVQSQLDAALANLETVSYEVTTTSQTLVATKGRADELAERNQACRYLIRVNDGLLYGMLAQQHATQQLMRGHKAAARAAVQRAAGHVRFVQKVVKRSGNRTISGLVVDCAPPST